MEDLKGSVPRTVGKTTVSLKRNECVPFYFCCHGNVQPFSGYFKYAFCSCLGDELGANQRSAHKDDVIQRRYAKKTTKKNKKQLVFPHRAGFPLNSYPEKAFVKPQSTET